MYSNSSDFLPQFEGKTTQLSRAPPKTRFEPSSPRGPASPSRNRDRFDWLLRRTASRAVLRSSGRDALVFLPARKSVHAVPRGRPLVRRFTNAHVPTEKSLT